MSSHWATSLVATGRFRLVTCLTSNSMDLREISDRKIAGDNQWLPSPNHFHRNPRNLRFLTGMEFWTSCSCCGFSCFLFPQMPQKTTARAPFFLSTGDQRVMDAWMDLAPCCSWLGMDLSSIFVPCEFHIFWKSICSAHIVFVCFCPSLLSWVNIHVKLGDKTSHKMWVYRVDTFWVVWCFFSVDPTKTMVDNSKTQKPTWGRSFDNQDDLYSLLKT